MLVVGLLIVKDALTSVFTKAVEHYVIIQLIFFSKFKQVFTSAFAQIKINLASIEEQLDDVFLHLYFNVA